MALAPHMHRDLALHYVGAWVWSSIIIVDEWVIELVLWTTSNRCLTVSSIKRNINNVCWAEQEGCKRIDFPIPFIDRSSKYIQSD